MKKKRTRMFFAILGFCTLLLLSADTAVANKTSVKILAPDSAAVGSEITIELQVSHDGNNFLHYTEWVYVKINGEEIKRWEFGNFSKPEDENFTRAITYTVTGPLDITAESNCNIHGSEGIAAKTVEVK
jgi:desulfoferrodoxin (superoxide reductase-like protein)